MRPIIPHILLLVVSFMLCAMASCRSHSNAAADGYRDRYLGMEISEADNHKLYHEIKGWIGTPYRYGGNTHDGVDCSGFIVNLYHKVYGVKLQRSSELIYKNNCSKIEKSQLCEGDLVFFKTGKGKRISHVGIYLKNGKFAHASTSRGVIISSLDDDYYRRNFLQAGRVKK